MTHVYWITLAFFGTKPDPAHGHIARFAGCAVVGPIPARILCSRCRQAHGGRHACGGAR